MNNEQNSINRFWSDLDITKIPTGILASSLIYSIIFNPLNVVLTYKRLDYEKESYKKIIQIIKQKHGFKGFYRGLPISIGGGFILDEIFLPSLEYSRENLNFGNQIKNDYFAGLFAHTLITPIYTTYHLLCNKQMGAGLKSTDPYQNLYHTTKSIIHNEGYRGLFKGLSLELSYVPFYALWWNIYSQYKYWMYTTYKQYNNTSSKNLFFSSNDNVIINGLAGGLAGCTITPLINPIDTISVKMQTYSKKYTVRSLIKNTYHNQGFKGFFSGMGLNFFEVFAEYAAYGIAYDGIKQYCGKS
jgi:solute carrier family 25 (mitochondrial folate transporter), member 32